LYILLCSLPNFLKEFQKGLFSKIEEEPPSKQDPFIPVIKPEKTLNLFSHIVKTLGKEGNKKASILLFIYKFM